ncbi:hypothetical protein NKH77_35250 [Streptomyces sp. M19]
MERLIDALRADFGDDFLVTLAPVATELSGGAVSRASTTTSSTRTAATRSAGSTRSCTAGGAACPAPATTRRSSTTTWSRRTRSWRAPSPTRPTAARAMWRWTS